VATATCGSRDVEGSSLWVENRPFKDEEMKALFLFGQPQSNFQNTLKRVK